MTPLEKIKNGILSQDWNMVKDGYSVMTGEIVENIELEIPEDNSQKKSSKQQKISVPNDPEQMEFITDLPDENYLETQINDKIKKLNKKNLKKDVSTKRSPPMFKCDGLCGIKHKTSEIFGSSLADGKMLKFCKKCYNSNK